MPDEPQDAQAPADEAQVEQTAPEANEQEQVLSAEQLEVQSRKYRRDAILDVLARAQALGGEARALDSNPAENAEAKMALPEEAKYIIIEFK